MAGDLLSCTQRLLGSRIGEASHLGPVRQNNAARTIDKTFSPTRLNTPDHLHTPPRPLPESFPVPRPFSRPFPRPSKARLPFDLSMLWRQATWQHKNGVKTVCGCAGKKRCKEVQNPTSDVPCRQRNRGGAPSTSLRVASSACSCARKGWKEAYPSRKSRAKKTVSAFCRPSSSAPVSERRPGGGSAIYLQDLGGRLQVQASRVVSSRELAGAETVAVVTSPRFGACLNVLPSHPASLSG